MFIFFKIYVKISARGIIAHDSTIEPGPASSLVERSLHKMFNLYALRGPSCDAALRIFRRGHLFI